MSYQFNPITGQLDLVSQSAVLDGEVETWADLPETPDPPLGSTYFVKNTTGVWLVNRKPAGIWIRTDDSEVRESDWTYAGDYPVNSVNGMTGNVVITPSSIDAADDNHVHQPTSVFADAVKVSGATMSGGEPNGIYLRDGTDNTKGFYKNAAGYSFYWDTVEGWTLSNYAQSSAFFESSSNTVYPWQATGWLVAANGSGTVPTITQATLNDIQFELAKDSVSTRSPTTGNAGSTQVVLGSDTRLTNARTPLAHLHIASDITDLSSSGNAAALYDNDLSQTGATVNDGCLRIYTSGAYAAIDSNALTTNRFIGLPDNSGIFALTSDFAAPPPIGNTTRNSGAFTTLSANNGTLTASAPVLDLAQTWNNAAVTFTGLRANFTDTASAAASKAFDLQVGGTSVLETSRIGLTVVRRLGASTFTNAFEVRRDSTLLMRVRDDGVITTDGTIGVGTNIQLQGGAGIKLRADFPVVWSSTGSTDGSSDTFLLRDGAANTLAQRNGTNPQTFRLYNTFTDASNYERAKIAWSSNVLQIGTEKGGTGSARALELQTDGTTRLTIATTGSATFTGAIATSGEIYAGTTSDIRFTSSTRLGASANGSLRLSNNALTDFDRLQFGGTTSSFPALKRSSTTLQVRLADDSADAPLSSASLTSGDGTRTSLAYLFAADTDTGFYRRGTNTFTFVSNNANVFEVVSNGVRLEVNSSIQWSFNDLSGSSDLSLFRDAADTLAQRRTTNAQTFRIYNTFTSSTNFERLNIRWASGECIIDAEAGSGGGTLRGIKIGSATSSLLGFYGATPVDRPATVADPTGGGTVDTEARTAINDIIDRLQELGLIA